MAIRFLGLYAWTEEDDDEEDQEKEEGEIGFYQFYACYYCGVLWAYKPNVPEFWVV